ncbi:hypothetical protein IQ17_06425 [Bradyrhizobium daqingense]|uniref:Uncharacterized protein n=1 Tax=Bradyrhizobium daqingense TaxID=993502 RepID=A0A562KMR3_9BRAD|nr:hypothetical protein IQ17_06425 [Bradyrhizobium daqingense]
MRSRVAAGRVDRERRACGGITGRDVVEYDDVRGTFGIAGVFLVHGCGDPAHAGLCDQQAKVGAINSRLSTAGTATRGGVSAKFSMDILRPPQLGALPLLVR